MAEIAEKLGETEDAAEFRAYSEGCQKAYQELVSGGKYDLDTNRQAQLVRPLALGLLTEKQTAFAEKRLLEALDHYGWRLGTGFLSTPFILQVLSSHGYAESAYRMLENTEAPGWLAMVKQGATTVFEEYECYDPDGHPLPHSFNHYSPGAVCAFLFDTICGVRADRENHVVIRPVPGGSLSYATAVVHTAYGKVLSSWEATSRFGPKRKIRFRVEIPSNMTATLILPDGKVHRRCHLGR